MKKWSFWMLVVACNLTRIIYPAGMSIWQKVHLQSWMILFLLIHISMFCTCHPPFHVQRDPGGLRNLQIVIPPIAWTLRMGLAAIWTAFDIWNVLTIYKKYASFFHGLTYLFRFGIQLSVLFFFTLIWMSGMA